jgi:purine-binding chemotaxis protein CheW
MERQIVIFELAGESYGVDIAAVEGIIKMQPITAMPHAPAFVEGVTNLRGSVLPVIDLRKRFNLPGSSNPKECRIVIADMRGTKIGMVVDSVSEVQRIPEESIEPPPPMVATVDAAFIKGIAKLADRLIILLDISKVLSSEEKNDLQRLPTTLT